MSVMNKEELSKLILENQKEMYVLAYSILKNQADAIWWKNGSKDSGACKGASGDFAGRLPGNGTGANQKMLWRGVAYE